MNKMIIAIDGPAGAGKSTIAKILADKLSITYIDTGAMYRAVAYKALETFEKPSEKDIESILEDTVIDFSDNCIFLDGKCVNNEIRTPKVSENVSFVAKIPSVRIKMVDLQRQMGKEQSVIMDGRDIGTYVFTDANYKFYLTASSRVRGVRRFEELSKNGYDMTLEEVISDIEKRDYQDQNRDFAPLKKADDAIEINTDDLNIDEVVEKILEYID